ncbi:MAG: hypothetical protein KGO94_01870 [Alphaproteobacteria bacterium]|nr:hypothetical protein [Alphaproteobacteria bacterium]
MGRIFWIFVAALVGLVVHIVYVLFLPSYWFEQQLGRVTEQQTVNAFFIAKPEVQARLLPSTTSQSIVGLCIFDLRSGPVALQATLPRTYWTFSVYSQSGRQVYALNDVQAGTSEFKVELSQTKTFLQQLLGNGRADDVNQVENLGWHAETSESRGIAVIWIPIADEAMRPQIEGVLKHSSCKPSQS